MTTHNTHSEHSDVEEIVVKHLPAVEMQEAASTDPLHETSAEGEQPSKSDGETPENPGTRETQQAPYEDGTPAAEVPLNATAREAAAHIATPSPAQEATMAGAFETEEEVRPFTDFIEEFRQAEARFSSSLQAYQTQAPATLNEETAAAAVLSPSEELLALEPVTAQETQVTPENPERQAAATPQAERPVSPLLRPASRLRMPRHASARQREELAAELGKEPAETETKVEPAVPEPQRPARRYRFDRPAAGASTAPATARPEESKEAATRASSTENGHAINGQGATAEKEAQAQPAARSGASSIDVAEKSASKGPAAEVSAAPAAVAPVTPTTTENERRKRHSQDRQRGKEQAAQPAAATPEPAVAESASQAQEVATTQVEEEAGPEDLPPLEYAELQKANTRRRRRRHTGSPPATAPGAATPAGKAITPETPQAAAVPAPTPTPAVSMPRTPAANSAPAPSQYSITSGFTVKQMSQGNDEDSPFMGPDPSPARGSMAAQNVRSLRTDVQRAPAYPVRTTEATSASVHQLANIVAQAIQTQTDRMVSELRRANQSPTNVSVSMPPFPSTERVGVFVDVANLLYSARTLRLTVDFGKLLDFLRGNRRLVRAHAYCPTSPQPGDEQMFLQAVKGLGYRITTKNYKTFSSGAKKADLDLDLCMDVVRLVDGKAVDCIVLVSGDSDFMPMLDYCSDHGVRVEVAAFDEAMSATLRQSCDLFINLGMLEEIRV